MAVPGEEHAGEGIHVALSAGQLGTFLGLPITNTLITSWIVVLVLSAVALLMRRKLALVPSRFQTLLEWAIEGVYDYVAEVLESRTLARRFFPLLMTIFLFVFVANMMEFIPGIGSITFDHIPLLRSVNTDLNAPLALALISFFVIEFTGILTLGFLKYGSKFITLRSPVDFMVGIVELIGELVRVISLSFRLFGNILAGEIIIAVAIFFVPFLLPVPLMLFEVFIGFLQAVIFALLTLFFIKLAIAEPHGVHEEAHAHA